MPFYGLSLISGIVGLVAFFYASQNGGFDAEVAIGEQVFTGWTLYGISLLSVVAAGLFLVAGLIKTIRKAVSLVAAIALAGGVGIGSLAPSSVADYAREHGCSDDLAGQNSTTQKFCDLSK